MGVACPKPSKGARLRTKKAHLAEQARALTSVYRTVELRDKFRCVACGGYTNPGSVNELQRGHHHHIVFRSQGGANTTANICLLCPICHADVHEHTLTIRGNADVKLTITRRGR